MTTHKIKAVTSGFTNNSSQKDSVRRQEEEVFLIVTFSLTSAKAIVDGVGLRDRDTDIYDKF